MTWREITAQELNALKNALIIDVRSPCEHEIERIPNSFNVPLLSDQERAIVGTIYKQEGEMLARRHALKIISPKIPALIEEIAALKKHGSTAVIYCWRGGLRSESVCSVLSIAGIDCFRLKGGFKAWRAAMLEDFERMDYPAETVVLHGLTGCGKTEILAELSNRGLQVLDLEALANHRGSVFGGMGLGTQPTQKNFDAALWSALRQLKPGVVFVEGESRKIGKVALPDCVFNRIQNGIPVLITGTLARRAERIAADYLRVSQQSNDTGMEQGLQMLETLKSRLGGKTTEAIRDLAASGKIQEAVTALLVEYYDPLYARQIARYEPYALSVDGDNSGEAADSIASWLTARNQTLARTSS